MISYTLPLFLLHSCFIPASFFRHISPFCLGKKDGQKKHHWMWDEIFFAKVMFFHFSGLRWHLLPLLLPLFLLHSCFIPALFFWHILPFCLGKKDGQKKHHWMWDEIFFAKVMFFHFSGLWWHLSRCRWRCAVILYMVLGVFMVSTAPLMKKPQNWKIELRYFDIKSFDCGVYQGLRYMYTKYQ